MVQAGRRDAHNGEVEIFSNLQQANVVNMHHINVELRMLKKMVAIDPTLVHIIAGDCGQIMIAAFGWTSFKQLEPLTFQSVRLWGGQAIWTTKRIVRYEL